MAGFLTTQRSERLRHRLGRAARALPTSCGTRIRRFLPAHGSPRFLHPWWESGTHFRDSAPWLRL